MAVAFSKYRRLCDIHNLLIRLTIISQSEAGSLCLARQSQKTPSAKLDLQGSQVSWLDFGDLSRRVTYLDWSGSGT